MLRRLALVGRPGGISDSHVVSPRLEPGKDPVATSYTIVGSTCLEVVP